MTQKTRNTSTEQKSRPFYLTTPLFRQANQIGVQGKSKDRETSLDPTKAGTHKVESDQESVPRKVFTDRRNSNKQHSVLYKGTHPRNNEVPKATLLPERFVNLLMTSGRKDKARKCLTLALFSITGRIGIFNPLKMLTDLPSKQNQIDLKPSAKQVLTSKNKANNKQGLTLPLSPKNQGKTPLSSKSKTDKPSNVLQGLSPTGFAKQSTNSLINACLANLKAVQKGFAFLPRTTQESQSNSYREIERVAYPPVSSEGIQSLASMYRANPGTRIEVIERIERGFVTGWTTPSVPSNSSISLTTASHEGRQLVDTKQQVEKELRACGNPFAKGINGEGGERPGLQQQPFVAWRDLLSVANDSRLARRALQLPNLCFAKGGRDPELAFAPFQSSSCLYLGYLPASRQGKGLSLTNQPAQKLEATLSLPFCGKRFETTSPVLLSQNTSSLSFVRRSLRERFVLTKSGIERRQETREGKDYLMGLLCQSFLSGLGHCSAKQAVRRKGCSANLTVVGFARHGLQSTPFNTTKTRLSPPPRLSALFRWGENRFPPLIGIAPLASPASQSKGCKQKVGFQAHSPGRNHSVKGCCAQRKGVGKPINWFSHFLAGNNSLEGGVEAVRGLFPFAQSTKAKRCAQQNPAERIAFLAKPRTVGKRWVELAGHRPSQSVANVQSKTNDNTNPFPWGLFPTSGNNPQGEKGQVLKDLYIWHTQVLLKGVQRVQPALEVRRVRKGRNTFQVPAVVKQKRGEKLAIKWIVDSARRSRQKGNKGFSESLGNQLLQSFDRLGEARSKRNELLRLAESNRPFLRFRWW